ncbi:type II secretion system minor pseudopilin GspI [Marinomonas sp. THO17]|uniref:type II secretion system minor pseudopilin GspI n=1 Tax=Marinomonas sp. THO17 TaxID=3149048 RepID=UPI00336BFFF3
MISRFNSLQQKGFSLIEVLIALAIIAAVSVVLMNISATTRLNAQHFSKRSIALWVAENRINEIRLALDHQWTISFANKMTEQGGIAWVSRVNIEKNTDSLSRLEIQVSPAEFPNQVIYSLDAYVPTYQLLQVSQ